MNPVIHDTLETMVPIGDKQAAVFVVAWDQDELGHAGMRQAGALFACELSGQLPAPMIRALTNELNALDHARRQALGFGWSPHRIDRARRRRSILARLWAAGLRCLRGFLGCRRTSWRDLRPRTDIGA